MLSIRIKRSNCFKIRDKGKAANRLFLAHNHITIANEYTYMCMRIHVYFVYIYFSPRFIEKRKKVWENWAGAWERERERRRGLMRREMMEFANHSALHFSLPCSRFPRPSSQILPSQLLSFVNPMHRTFLASDLGAVHFTLVQAFLLTPAGFNKKFKSQHPAARIRQSSISALKPATQCLQFATETCTKRVSALH